MTEAWYSNHQRHFQTQVNKDPQYSSIPTQLPTLKRQGILKPKQKGPRASPDHILKLSITWRRLFLEKTLNEWRLAQANLTGYSSTSGRAITGWAVSSCPLYSISPKGSEQARTCSEARICSKESVSAVGDRALSPKHPWLRHSSGLC